MYVFIAGGIGITPFRSIVAHHLATKQKLDAVLFHFASSDSELLFRSMFEEAVSKISIAYVPNTSQRFSQALLTRYVPDIEEKVYYLSGSDHFIQAIRESLYNAGIDEDHIKTDIFSGY